METKVNKSNVKKEDFSSKKMSEIPINLKEILSFLVYEKFIDFKKVNKKGDFEKNIRQSIEEAFKDRYQNLNENFSELRKGGRDMGVLNFKLMMLPLKIKVFLSTYEKKDAENVLNRIKEIESEITKINR